MAQRRCDSLAKILAAENRSKSDLLKPTIFVKDISQLSHLREQLYQFYEGALPTCSLVEISNLFHPDLLIELEATVSWTD